MLKNYYLSLGLENIPEEIINQLIPTDPTTQTVDDCDHDYLLTDTGYSCQKCGITNGSKFIPTGSHTPKKNHHIYKRKNYFVEKMRLLTGIKQTTHPKYVEMIDLFKKFKISNIKELKSLMKQYGYVKFYKYINTVWFDLTGEKLINLTYNDIKLLSFKFQEFERKLKKDLTGRVNFPNYNTIIYVFLKKNGYDFHNHIILPKNQESILKIIEN